LEPGDRPPAPDRSDPAEPITHLHIAQKVHDAADSLWQVMNGLIVRVEDDVNWPNVAAHLRRAANCIESAMAVAGVDRFDLDDYDGCDTGLPSDQAADLPAIVMPASKGGA
jgi:hypothetical protein